jgi:methylated-DNA-protein-cysteine methyltransferase related protein
MNRKNKKEPDSFNAKNDDFTFFEQVYAVVRLIPPGRVTSYGAIAKYLGAAGSARMVGWAMNAAHSAIPPVPAQRVVNRNGLLTGKHHFGGGNMMQTLLENEGVAVKDDQVIKFKEIFWDPVVDLKI